MIESAQRNHPVREREIAELITKLSIACFGLAYISGYLIVTDHMESLGIRSAGETVLKAKYVWIGYLYLLPFFAVTALFARLYLRPNTWLFKFGKLVNFRAVAVSKTRDANNDHRSKGNYIWVIVATIVLIGMRMLFFDSDLRESTSCPFFLGIFAFLVYQISYLAELGFRRKLTAITLTDPQNSGDQESTSLYLAERAELERQRTGWKTISKNMFGIVMVVGSCVFLYAIYAFFEGQPAWIMHSPLITYSDCFLFGSYVATVLALHIQLFIAFRRDAEPSQEPGAPSAEAQKRARWVARGVMTVALFPASIHGFTHVIYPHIPVERGGGDYATGQVVDVCLRPAVDMLALGLGQDLPQHTVPTSYCPSGVILSKMVVLEEEPETVYLASVYDQGIQSGVPDSSNSACGVKKWHQAMVSPKVIAVSISTVQSIRDTDTVQHLCK